MDLENFDFEALHRAIISRRFEMTAQQKTTAKNAKTGAPLFTLNMNFVYMPDEDGDTDFRMIADTIAHQLEFNGMKHKDLEKAIITLGEALSKEERQAIRDRVGYVEKEPSTLEIVERSEDDSNK